MVHNFGILDISLVGGARNNIHYGFWTRMIERCYSEKSLARSPSYRGCLICDEWRYFSKFYEWSLSNYHDGMVLDKDLSCLSGDLYSPERCCYIPQELNKAILDSTSARGEMPLGTWRKKPSKGMVNERSRPFVAELNNRKLGSFKTASEAHQCWQKAKMCYFRELAERYKNIVDRKAVEVLLLRAYKIEQHLLTNTETKSVARM
ncbi:hypothetical protein NDO71_orf149 [Klebsiella phage vB_KpnM_NDO71]|nr:hypothetical protein NDO71_orf149 [Klebsiella phage vB_KpnM_NDO71]